MSKKSKEEITKDRLKVGVKISKQESNNLNAQPGDYYYCNHCQGDSRRWNSCYDCKWL